MSDTTLIPFRDLTTDEAEAIVNQIKRQARSDEEVRRKLTEAGFDGKGAAICSTPPETGYIVMIMVFGPNGQIITGKPPRQGLSSEISA